MAKYIMRSTKHGTMPNGSLWDRCSVCGLKYYYCYVIDGVCIKCEEK